jgi:hypothetical protein
MKRRVTLIMDEPGTVIPGARVRWCDGIATVESVEDIPDPDRVQEFRVQVVTDPEENPWTAGYVERRLRESVVLSHKSIWVHTVDPEEGC